jgi:hypothetical protein
MLSPRFAFWCKVRLQFWRAGNPPVLGNMAAQNGAPHAMTSKPLMILVAGPYRSGTGDDPAKIAANMRVMNDVALALYRAGHLPMTGEAMALALIETAGSQRMGDAIWDSIFHPLAERLAGRCDACLRIGGASAGADAMVAMFAADGRPVYRRLYDVPAARNVVSSGPR